MSSRACSESVPTTTLSGFIKSSIAAPSLRNSGLEATSKRRVSHPLFASALRMVIRTCSAVPTGTVLLLTTRT